MQGGAEEQLAEAIARNLGVPTASIAPEDAFGHFGGFLGGFVTADNPASSALTRQWLGREPVQPGLIADLGHYFA